MPGRDEQAAEDAATAASWRPGGWRRGTGSRTRRWRTGRGCSSDWLRGEPGDKPAVGRPFVVDPQAAHRVVDGGEDLHRRRRAGRRPGTSRRSRGCRRACGRVRRAGCASGRGRRTAGRVSTLRPSLTQTSKISRVAMSRGTRLPYFGIALFEEVVALGLGNRLADRAGRAACGAPRRGRLRRGPIRSSAAACRRRGSPSGGPG